MRTALKSFLVFFLLSLPLAGCVSVSGLYQDPSFTYEAVIADHIGVGGVVSTVAPLSQPQQIAYAGLLRNALIEKYPGLNVMPAGDTVRAMGPGNYKNMINYYQQNGVVPTENLNNIKAHVHGMRYIAFARITQSNVTQRRSQSDGYDPKNNMSNIDYVTALNMQVDLVVYDLNQGHFVWSGTLTESRENKNSYLVPNISTDKDADYKKQAVQDIASVYMQTQIEKSHDYPTPPSESNLLASIFSDFMTKFPKPQN